MISTLQYQEMLRRLSPKQQTGIYEPCTHEVGKGGLHERIEEYCRSKGWVYVHSRTDQRSTTALATPDFVIAADDGRTFWIECKRKGSKATPEQQGKILMLQKLGHKATIVWSYEEFLAFIATPNPILDAAPPPEASTHSSDQPEDSPRNPK